MKSKFGEILNLIQIQRGLSNKELAKLLGVTESRVTHMKGCRNPQPKTIYRVSKVLDVQPDVFLSVNG